MSDKQPVLLPDGGRTDRVFDEVVVEARERVLLMRDERVPVIDEIRTRFADERARQHLRAQSDRDTAQPVERSGKVLVPQRGTGIADLRRQVEEDIVIFDHKIWNPRPALSRADGPIVRFREWARQFYVDGDPGSAGR